MKITHDREADALYIKLKSGKVKKTIKNAANFLVDVDKSGGVIGIEVLNYSKTVPEKSERWAVSAGSRKILIPA